MPMSRLFAGTRVMSLAADAHRARRRAARGPASDAQRGRLAAARRPEQGDELAGGDVQVQPVEGVRPTP